MASADPLLAALFGDAEMAALMGGRAAISAMLRAEAALARAQGDLGIIPEQAAQAIEAACARTAPEPGDLAAGIARAGIAAQPVVAALKAAAGSAAPWVHYGATSQDIVDTALVLQARDALSLLAERLGALEAALTAQAARWAGLAIPARTRFQDAVPTTLGAKIAIWRAPLARHRARLAELRPRLMTLSLHGAAGTGAAFRGQGPALRRALAARLGLAATEIPWHASRDSIAELAGWLSLITGTLGKIGLDLTLLAQDGWVRAGEGGASSAMPQKANPVAAEALVTLARLNAADLASMHHALIHAQERDGTALALEWLTLPAMLERTAAALRHARELAGGLAPDEAVIAAHFAADRGAMMTEAATSLLELAMPRPEAQRHVAAALRAMRAEPGLTLAGALARAQPGRDWESLLAPRENLGDAPRLARNTEEKTP